MERDSLVQKLIDCEVDRLERGTVSLWLLRVLERGFQGFANMTDRELQNEARRNGIRYEFGIPQEAEDEIDDADAEADADDVDDVLRDVAGVAKPTFA